MHVTKLDRLLANWLPGLALKRIVDRHNLGVVATTNFSSGFGSTGGGYDGGKNGRRRASVWGATANEDEVAAFTYENMIANSMQLYRNDPMTKSIVDLSGNYLGASRPTAATSDPEWNKLTTEWFNEYWWAQADARGRMGVDYGQIQILFDKWSWIGGDMLYLLFEGRLLPYEGLQVDTPSDLRADLNVVNGIRVEPSAPWRVTHYYLRDVSKKSYDRQAFKRILQSNAIYAGSENWRTAMLRSVPDLHGVIDALHSFNSTNDNVQKRIEFESMLFTVERKGAAGALPGRKVLGASGTDGQTIQQSRADWGMRMMVNGSPKDDFLIAEMKNPNSQYVQTMEFMARAIAAGTGFPYEAILHTYTSGSYSANRAAWLDLERAILKRWAWRNKVLNQRVWNWRIAKAMKEGELPLAPRNEVTGLSEWHKVTWTLPHFKHIDEMKETSAAITKWGCGKESFNDWASQRQMTVDQLLDAHDKDIKMMQGRASKLNITLDQYMSKLFSQPKPEAPNAETE